MSQYYTAQRTKNLFDPTSDKPFILSRSKIDLFLECSHCFYLDRRLGVSRPPGFPFNLNSAVDTLMKKEFDIHRAKETAHPLMKTYGIDAVPYQHPDIDDWRNTFKGIRYHHQPTNFVVTGAIDDIWTNPKGELIVVDYKATSKNGEITIDAPWQIAYKRQIEIYQWLLRRNGFNISNTGYFVYCNGRKDARAFDGKLEFDISVLPYKGDDTWVEGTLKDIHVCLMGNTIPDASAECDYCQYRDAAQHTSNNQPKKQAQKELI